MAPADPRALLRQDAKRGLRATFHYYATLPRLRRWSLPPTILHPELVPVHVLVGAQDWLPAAWAVASWVGQTGRRWHLVFHDDGTLPAAAATDLARIFPGADLISRAAADAELAGTLAGHPRCQLWRKHDPSALRVLDTTHYGVGGRILLLEPDILFFRHPAELLDHLDGPYRECWFAEHVAELSLVAAAEADRVLRVKLWPQIDAGLALLFNGLVDLDFCERILATTGILKGDPRRIAPTMLALCASWGGTGGLLSAAYEVSLAKRMRPETVARHYFGPTRPRFYTEGLPRVAKFLFR